MMKQCARILSAIGFTVAASANGAVVDLTKLDRGMTAPRTQILVLGSMHLGETKDFKVGSLDHLLDKLAAFKPQIITIEAVPGEQCAEHPALYDSNFCDEPKAAKAATGLDVATALAAIKKTFADWPAQPTPEQRRHLSALFLAANDNASAAVQWLQLPASERHAGDGLDDKLVTMLESSRNAASESDQIAARLAARLGLQRVYPIDDHTGDDITVTDDKAFGEALQSAWNTDKAQLTAVREEQKKLSQDADWLLLYRSLNSPEYQWLQAKANVSGAMQSKSPERYPQIWVGGWETRNLRMVANVRESFREQPGARVLCLVGASHKPWFEGLLGQMQGVDIVDVEKVLK